MFLVRDRSESDPTLRYSYSLNTSNTSLWNHLDSRHREKYLQACEDNNWKNQLPSAKKSVNLERPPGLPVHIRIPFSQKALLDHLVSFIVADDQVSRLLVVWSLL